MLKISLNQNLLYDVFPAVMKGMTCDCHGLLVFFIKMRHLFVVVDNSRTMDDQDLKPNRLTSTLKVRVIEQSDKFLKAVDSTAEQCELFVFQYISIPRLHDFYYDSLVIPQLLEFFVDEYFDQNPISQVRFFNLMLFICVFFSYLL